MKYIAILFVLCVFFVPHLTGAFNVSFYRNLTLGSSGQDVVSLQNYLISLNYLGKNLNTGYFGQMTKAAVKKYQKSVGVPQTGYFGILTRQKITAESPKPIAGIEGVTWYAAGKDTAWVVFENGKVRGNICNNFSGTLTIDTDLRIHTTGDIASTMMFCADTDIQNLESLFHKLIQSGSKIVVDGTGLSIVGTEGKINFTKNTDSNIPLKKNICTSVEGGWSEHNGTYTCTSYQMDKLTEKVCNSMGSTAYTLCGSPVSQNQNSSSGLMYSPTVCVATCANIR